MCVNGELIGTHCRAIEWAIPYVPGRKVPHANFSQPVGGRQKCQQSIFKETFAGCEAMQ